MNALDRTIAPGVCEPASAFPPGVAEHPRSASAPTNITGAAMRENLFSFMCYLPFICFFDL
jgi:hypothetical protein